MYNFPEKNIHLFILKANKKVILFTTTSRVRVDEKRIEKTEKKNAKPDLF